MALEVTMQEVDGWLWAPMLVRGSEERSTDLPCVELAAIFPRPGPVRRVYRHVRDRHWAWEPRRHCRRDLAEKSSRVLVERREIDGWHRRGLLVVGKRGVLAASRADHGRDREQRHKAHQHARQRSTHCGCGNIRDRNRTHTWSEETGQKTTTVVDPSSSSASCASQPHAVSSEPAAGKAIWRRRTTAR